MRIFVALLALAGSASADEYVLVAAGSTLFTDAAEGAAHARLSDYGHWPMRKLGERDGFVAGRRCSRSRARRSRSRSAKAPRCGCRRVRAGAPIYWRDGRSAGVVDGDAGAVGKPTVDGTRRCVLQPVWIAFGDRALKDDEALILCFDSSDLPAK